MNKLVIIGASGHGKVVADIAEKNGYSDIVFLDDDSETEFCGEYAVVGESTDAPRFEGSDFVVAIGNANTRCEIQSFLTENGLNAVSLVHPSAVVARKVKIGAGTVVMAGAVINPGAEIGSGCIINTCSSVDHDCRVGNFVHVSVGTHLAGTVTVGDKTWVGAGVTVSNNVNIAANCTIGAGAVVINDIEKAGVYVGVPAKLMREADKKVGWHRFKNLF